MGYLRTRPALSGFFKEHYGFTLSGKTQKVIDVVKAWDMTKVSKETVVKANTQAVHTADAALIAFRAIRDTAKWGEILSAFGGGTATAILNSIKAQLNERIDALKQIRETVNMYAAIGRHDAQAKVALLRLLGEAKVSFAVFESVVDQYADLSGLTNAYALAKGLDAIYETVKAIAKGAVAALTATGTILKWGVIGFIAYVGYKAWQERSS